MNNPIAFVLASVVITTMRSGCGGKEIGFERPQHTDPMNGVTSINAVCKVGQQGGDGTLIAPQWVLTAAHVAYGLYRRSEGALNVYFDDGTIRSVDKVYLHPRFTPMGRYDIALLQLKESVPHVEPVPYYTGNDELGRMIILAGHGDRRNPDGTWLRDGKLRTYTNVVDAVDDTHLLFDYDAPGPDATDKEGTSGPGDSGGPALIGTDGSLRLAGISSMGEPGNDGPCSYGAVEHFVRVSQFSAWLDAVVQDPSAHPFLEPVPPAPGPI